MAQRLTIEHATAIYTEYQRAIQQSALASLERAADAYARVEQEAREAHRKADEAFSHYCRRTGSYGAYEAARAHAERESARAAAYETAYRSARHDAAQTITD